ncbi:phage T7 F exclusion suppressor FxsA [Roseivivax sp. THAF40]|uniref:FxsA family protein n=1 Tax=Roseivivax sp. THAF40 TaxID=2587858 RepID=UPI00126852A3|nr:FxsA family protein [Roseivivax sp. THAF40]QFT48561.1 phage T7 F exclusion suppressor FxsA [Roseivivax sp. THAF40]
MWLLLAFIGVPLIEIALFIQVGGFIGLWPTLLIVVLTAMLGTYLVRSQGALALSELRSSFNDLRDPTEPLAHGAMILFAGALLLTPGFFTDAVGFALLTPPFRRAAIAYARKHVKVSRFEMGGDPRRDPRQHAGVNPGRRPPRDGDVIDGDYVEVDPAKRPTHPGNSGWTKH